MKTFSSSILLYNTKDWTLVHERKLFVGYSYYVWRFRASRLELQALAQDPQVPEIPMLGGPTSALNVISPITIIDFLVCFSGFQNLFMEQTINYLWNFITFSTEIGRPL